MAVNFRGNAVQAVKKGSQAGSAYYQGGGGQAKVSQFASTRLRAPDRQVSIPSTNKATLWRLSAGSPPYEVRNPRVCLPGFYCNNAGGTPTERVNSDAFNAAYSIEVGGVRVRATFGGSNWTTRGGTGASKGYSTPFDWGIWSDPIKNTDGSDYVIPANSQIFHQTLVEVATAGLLFPGSQAVASAIGDRQRVAADSSTLEALLTSGTINTSGSGPVKAYAPMFMVAERVDNGEKVVLITGDSRAYSNADFGTGMPAGSERAPLAAVERGLDSVTGGRVASGSITVPGSGAKQSVNGVYSAVDYTPGLTHRLEPLLVMKGLTGKAPFTHIIDQHGNNGNPDFATLLATHVAVMKAAFPGIPYIKVTIPPRVGTTTADAFKTLAGMNAVDPYDQYPSGGRAAFNNAILADAGANFTAVWDAGIYGSAAYDPATGTKLPTSDPNFNDKRSKFMTAPRSAVLSSDYTSTTTMILTSALQVGDSVAIDNDRTHICGPIRQITDNGNGTFTHLIEIGGNSSGVTITAGNTVVVVPTKDGTHEEAWLHMVEAQAYIDAKLAGAFN
jgi:hypothetical protein